MLDRLGQRPIIVALLLAVAAQALFSLHLGRPAGFVFDEAHYVPAARVLLALDHPANIEHPLVGKGLIAIGIALFGDNPIGWRALSTLAGTATVIGVFAILMSLFGRVRIAAFGALLVMLNQMVFVQARAAMLDGFLAAFVVGALAMLLWAKHAPARGVAWRVAGAGVLLGLAVGTKWAAIPYCAMAGLWMLWVRRRAPGAWAGTGIAALLALLAATSIATYFASFAPAFFYRSDPLTPAGLLAHQLEMYRLQTTVLATHGYQSDWWSWPLMLRPVWYYYALDDGVQRGVLLVGNPAILWGGLIALGGCAWAGLRDGSRNLAGVAMLCAASLLIYALIPKSLGFFYYYLLSGIFLCVAIAAAHAHFGNGRWRNADRWFLIVAAGLFVYFHPILSGAPLDGRQAFLRWTWFPGWI